MLLHVRAEPCVPVCVCVCVVLHVSEACGTARVSHVVLHVSETCGTARI